MVERFNGRISELLAATQFISQEQLEEKLCEYLNLYNHHIAQKNLGHISPAAKLKEWQKPILSYLLKKFTINRELTIEKFKLWFFNEKVQC